MALSDQQLTDFLTQSNLPAQVSELHDFPWTDRSYPQLVQAIQARQIIPAVYYDSNLRHTLLSSREKLFTDLLGYLMFSLPAGFLVSALLTHRWILLLGIPGFLLAAFVSSPWAASKRSFLMWVAFLGAFISYWAAPSIAVVLTGLLLSLWLAVFSRQFVNSAVKRRIRTSEAAFCYTYHSGLLLLQDATTQEIFGRKGAHPDATDLGDA